MTAAIVAD